MPFKLIICCFTILFLGQNPDEETMSWNESRKLTWADFKANPIENSEAVALTASGITFGYSLQTSGKRIVDFSNSVEAHFYPNQSWYHKDRSDDYILSHEQLHFDITELYARKLREQLSKLVVNQNVKAQMQRLHTRINKAVDLTQKRYDEESNHSINIEVQKKWEQFIQAELTKLDKYKSQ
ncbi:MAG: DUF922 domain-containing protein [Winogradskyella sp.]|uniref:DUF922 domain-containing protein n=1 Tax=Winogradskyella sp. TaxID=1883156 RepID=UPI0017E99E62|nr:DUF922 domain-containing protein [Winogradskyella sp.]